MKRAKEIHISRGNTDNPLLTTGINRAHFRRAETQKVRRRQAKLNGVKP
jgi:hypothetical protein